MLLNRTRAVDWLAECRLDAVVATTWVNVLYFTGYYLWLQPLFKSYMASPGAGDELAPLYAIVTASGDSQIVVGEGCELNAGEIPALKRFVYGPGQSAAVAASASQAADGAGFERTANRFPTAADALVAAIKSAGISSGRVGIEMTGFGAADRSAMESALHCIEILNASNLLRIIRMVKSDEEIYRMRRAAEINELAANECLALATPGCQMLDLVAAYRATAAQAGADFDHYAFSQRGVGFATESPYRSSDRETMFVDFGCNYRHYLSDAGVTLAVGGLPEHERETHRVLVECIRTGAELLTPGRKASTVQAAMNQVLSQANLTSCFAHGHGIGLELRDYPILVPDTGRTIRDDCVELPADLPLENGMIINLEAPLFEYRSAAFQVEQSYLVTPQGGEPLTGRDLSHLYVAGV